MKIIYLANVRVPTENAHGLQIAKMCEALAQIEAEVILLVPRRNNHIKADIFSYYSLEKNFKIETLPTFDLNDFGRVGFWLQNFFFSLVSFFYCLSHPNFDLIYSRDELPLLFVSFLTKKTIWEIHINRYNFLTRILTSKVSAIVAISGGLKKFLEESGVNLQKILVCPDAVDLSIFDRLPKDKKILREKLGLLPGRLLVTYVGKYTTMNQDKGVDDLIKAFTFVHRKLPLSQLLLVGIQNTVIERLKNILVAEGISENDYCIITHKPHDVAMQYVKTGDVLIMNYPNIGHYTLYMSPLKLFEYMASGNPIVSTSLPSIREILSSDEAYLIEPNNIESLVNSIVYALNNPEESNKKARLALDLVRKKYTWESRAKNILRFFKDF